MAEEEIVGVVVRDETEKERLLREKMSRWELSSPDRIESAARQIIGLVTALYTVLFGVLALAGDPLPVYLKLAAVRWLGALAALALGLALVAALIVVMPARYAYASASLTQQKQVFDRILRRKSGWLTAALVCFGFGLAAFGALLVRVMLAVGGP
jgi:cyanate permease